MQWFTKNRSYLPAVFALLAVIVFWVTGAMGFMTMVREPETPVEMLTGLYLMLAFAAGSIIIVTVAVMDLVRRAARQQNRPIVP